MVTLRLFHSANPFDPIDSRIVVKGEIAVGRDPAVDWPIEDAAYELSRRHCAIAVTADGISVRDLSANGVFLGAARRRIVINRAFKAGYERQLRKLDELGTQA